MTVKLTPSNNTLLPLLLRLREPLLRLRLQLFKQTLRPFRKQTDMIVEYCAFDEFLYVVSGGVVSLVLEKHKAKFSRKSSCG
jgi:hypothetical protein